MEFLAAQRGFFLVRFSPKNAHEQRCRPFECQLSNLYNFGSLFCMKKILLIVCMAAFGFFSCQKNSSDISETNGSWKLLEVYDKSTSTASHKPVGSDLDVVITFLNGNSFAGHTLRNTISDGAYNQSGGVITFGSFSMTKVAEDEWGNSFLTVLHSCYLQSQIPCLPSSIQVQGNIMKIITSLRYDITLQRI
jgi:hypothetical protein